MHDIELMRQRILDIGDSNNPYSQEDFNKEFSTATITSNPEYFKIKLKFVNKSNNPNPEYQTDGASGFDIRAFTDEPIVLKSGDYKLIPTGLYFDIPDNMEITVRPRSGLALKHGITVLNSPGTIDNDYYGTLGVLLINHGKEDFIINNGDRIAQAVLSSVICKPMVNLEQVESIDNSKTNRDSAGFGSTGTK